MSHAKTIFSNLLSLSIGEALGKGLMFFVTIYLARVLEPEAFGQYSFVLAFISFFYITSQMGLDSFGSREIAKFREKAVYYLNAVMSLKFVMSILNYIFLVILVFALRLDPIVSDMLLIFGLSIFANALLTEFYFTGLERMNPSAIGKIIRPVIFALLVCLFIHSKTDLIWVPVYYVIGHFASMFYLLFVAYKKNTFEFNIKPYKNFLGVSVILGLSSLLGLINFQIDKLIIPMFDSFENLGLYETGVRLVYMISIVFTIIWTVFIPRLSLLVAKKNSFKKTYDIFNTLTLFVGFYFAGFFFIFSEEILNLFFGVDYLAASDLFIYFGMAIILYALSNVFRIILYACHLEKKQLIITFYSAGLNILLNLFLIPFYGIKGAAISTVISSSLLFILGLFYTRHLIVFNWFKLGKFILILGLSSFLTWFISAPYFLISIIMFSMFFVILAFIFKILKNDLFIFIKSLFNKKGGNIV